MYEQPYLRKPYSTLLTPRSTYKLLDSWVSDVRDESFGSPCSLHKHFAHLHFSFVIFLARSDGAECSCRFTDVGSHDVCGLCHLHLALRSNRRI